MNNQNIFDNEIFFNGYKALRDNEINYNDLLEQPAMAKQDVIDGKTAWFHGFETKILGDLWNIDIWFFDEKAIANAVFFSNNIKTKLSDNPTAKDIVISIKQALIANGQYSFDKYSSMDVYKAVFEDEISSYDEFIIKYKK